MPDTGKNEELKMKNKTTSQSNKTYDTVHTGDDEKIMWKDTTAIFFHNFNNKKTSYDFSVRWEDFNEFKIFKSPASLDNMYRLFLRKQ